MTFIIFIEAVIVVILAGEGMIQDMINSNMKSLFSAGLVDSFNNEGMVCLKTTRLSSSTSKMSLLTK